MIPKEKQPVGKRQAGKPEGGRTIQASDDDDDEEDDDDDDENQSESSEEDEDDDDEDLGKGALEG